MNSKKEKKFGTLKEYFVKAFQLPGDCVMGSTNIVLSGKNRLFVENYRNIIEYTDTTLKIQGKSCKIFITGKSLYIESYSADMMLVKGLVMEIKYI